MKVILEAYIDELLIVVQDLNASKTAKLCVLAILAALEEWLRGEVTGRQALAVAAVALGGIFLRHGQVTEGFRSAVATPPDVPPFVTVFMDVLDELGLDIDKVRAPVMSAYASIEELELVISKFRQDPEHALPPKLADEIKAAGIDPDVIRGALLEAFQRVGAPLASPSPPRGANDARAPGDAPPPSPPKDHAP